MPPTEPALFDQLGLAKRIASHTIGDIRDRGTLAKAVASVDPDFVFHLAAQPLVRLSYREPVETFDTNVMGTVNLLEAVRQQARTLDERRKTCSVVCITTDKVYENNESGQAYKESDPFGGYDPYSASKGACEIAIASYRRSFFNDPANPVWVASARAGNVIGGGDFAPNRIIPDCVRAAASKQPIVLRNPYSIRPYQHVLEPLIVYLTIAMRQYENPELAGSYNVGPDLDGCVTTGELAKLFCDAWGEDMQCCVQPDGGPHEAAFLKLDCDLLKKTFDWKPTISVSEAVGMTVEWTKVWLSGDSLTYCMDRQIAEALKRAN